MKEAFRKKCEKKIKKKERIKRNSHSKFGSKSILRSADKNGAEKESKTEEECMRERANEKK